MKRSILIALIVLGNISAHANAGIDTPEDPKLPQMKIFQREWKILDKKTESGNVQFEWIPSNQTKDNYSEVLHFGFRDITSDKNMTVERFYEKMLIHFTLLFQGSEIAMTKIEQGRSDLIFEFMLPNGHIVTQQQAPIPYKEGKIHPQHEIDRIFIHEEGNSRYLMYVSCVKLHGPLNSEERSKRIKDLKENVIVRVVENESGKDLSLIFDPEEEDLAFSKGKP